MTMLLFLGLGLVVFVASADENALRTGEDSSFTYVITNSLIWPLFNSSISLKIVGDNSVIHYMQQACIQDPHEFKSYTAVYTPPYGYLILAINGLHENFKDNKTCWEFRNATGAIHTAGVSSYIPSAGDRVQLNFSTDPNC